jgi:histidine triad (HIT) family protein
MNCIFCKIVHGQIPAAMVYEDAEVMAFLDISPIEKGHVLVVPRQHWEVIMDAPEALVQHTVCVVQKVARALMANGAIGVNVLQNNYAAAGQVVPHLHVHVIPRYTDSERFWTGGRYASDTERDHYAHQLSIRLDSTRHESKKS